MSDNCNCYPEKPTIKLPIQSIGFPCQGMSIDIDASAIEQCHCTLASPVQQGQVPEGGLIKQVYQVSEDGKRYEFRELPLATETESGLALRLATNSEVKLGDGKGLVSAEQLVFLLSKLEELEERDRQIFYPGVFSNFYEQTPFSGWAVRDGAILEDADEAYPELWAALQKPENAWKVKTLAEWTALSTTAGGVGGVPFFVLNASTKTIKLPDTRGDYERAIGGGTMVNVGNWHGDAIRNISGAWQNGSSSGNLGATKSRNGVFSSTTPAVTINSTYTTSSTTIDSTVNFDASRVVPTASENRTRAFGVLPCVYIGGI